MTQSTTETLSSPASDRMPTPARDSRQPAILGKRIHLGLTALARVGSMGVILGLTAHGQTITELPGSGKTVYLIDNRLAYERLSTLGKAMGDRLSKPGTERSQLVGRLIQKGAVTPLRLTRDISGAYKLEEVNGRTIASFDGSTNTTPTAGRKPEDDPLEETLTQDVPEVFLFAVANQQAYRFLGGRYRTDDGTTKDYQGPWLDIYQLPVALENRPEKTRRLKLFFFDSTDYLLRRVAYDVPGAQGRVTQVEVFWEGWRNVAGQRFPSRISRRENGVEVWTFEILEAAAGPRINNEKF
jgi:hypothetical protein